MKKKILSTLLAVCLFVGMAIPAVSAATSDVAGDAKKVTKIVAAKDSYEIEVNTTTDFADEITVLETENKLVLDKQHIRYDIQGVAGDYTDFTIAGSKVTARRAGAEARLTIYDNYSKNARVTVNVKSVAGNSKGLAESATFVDSTYAIPYTTDFNGKSSTGKSENVTLKMESHPKGTNFDADDVKLIDEWVTSRIEYKLGLNDDASFDGASIGYAVTRTDLTEGVASSFKIDLTGVVADATAGTIVLTVGGVALTQSASAASYNATTLAAAIATANNTGVAIGGVTYSVSASGTTLIFIAQTQAPSTVEPTAYSLAATTTAITTQPTSTAVTSYVKGVTPVAAKIVIKLDNSAVKKNDVFEIAGMRFVATADDAAAGVLTGLASAPFAAGWTGSASGNELTITGAGSCIATPVMYKNGKAITSTTSDLVGVPSKLFNTRIDPDNGNIMLIEIPYSALEKMKNKDIVDGGNISFTSPKVKRLDGNNDAFTASTNLNTVLAVRAEGISVAPNFEVAVGGKKGVDVVYYPANANVGKDITKTITRWNGDNKPFQYATMDGGDILGVNANDPGKARLETKLTGTTRNPRTDKYVFVSNITITPYVINGTVTPQTGILSAKEMTVGGVLPIEVINLPRDVTVKWSYESTTDAIVDFTSWDGAKTNITAKKVGTVKVIATLSNGEKYSNEITVKAAAAVPAPVPPATDATGNPQTGDSLFANLFA